MLPEMYPLKAHAEILAPTQSGKSKLEEGFIRLHAHPKCGDGCCLMDWHGKTFYELVEYFAYVFPLQLIILLDFSRPKFVHTFNPFALPPGRNLSAHVSRLTDVILKAWGVTSPDLLPTFRRIVKLVLAFCSVTGEPLHHGAILLERSQKNLRT